MITYCRAVGISSWEGLCASFTGSDPHIQDLQRWAPLYRLQAWSLALAHFGVDDPSLAEVLAAAFIHQRLLAQIVYPEVETVLATLQSQYQLGLITNGASDLQREKLRKSQLEPYFDAVIISGEVGIGKPDPTIFMQALKRLSACPEQTVMIGDSLSRDIAGAHNAGMRGILINRQDKDRQWNEQDIIPDGELPSLISLKEVLEALSSLPQP
jgi:putative hydrolase of the HAD superfamily